MDINEWLKLAEAKRLWMVEQMRRLVAIPAVNPGMGGGGEYQAVKWLESLLDTYEIPYEEFAVADARTPEGQRLNLIVRLPAADPNCQKTLWLVGHMDTVSPGDLSLWHTDPFELKVDGGKLYGLGAEDNGQGVICALAACVILWEQGIRPGCNVGFLFAADEETGSAYGFVPVLQAGYFGPEDEAIIPDGGQADGAFVELAEKSFFLVRLTTLGKQGHAAWPQQAVNAFSVGCRLVTALEQGLAARFPQQDALFDPPCSTFVPTQKFANVESTNIIPGSDAFVLDMRILPQIDLDLVEAEIRRIAAEFEQKYLVSVQLEILDKAPAPPPTRPEAPLVQRLLTSLRQLELEPRCGGIGGGTCGEFLRRAGIPSAVWSTVLELAHQPNEYAVLDNMVRDTAVFLSVIDQY